MKTYENYSLLPNNTFGIDVKTNYFIEYDSLEELQQLLHSDLLAENKFLHIGGGSNLLFIGDYQGVILHSNIKGMEAVEGTRSTVVVRVGAGERWDDFVAWCVSKNYGGVENLSGIPGEVGATPIQNIGAYGVEVKEVIEKVECVCVRSGEECSFTRAQCKFGYRDSIFKKEWKGKYIVTAVHFKLCKTSEAQQVTYGSLAEEIKRYPEVNLQTVRQAVLSIRQRKLPEPKVWGNAGSFFINPVIPIETYESLREQYPDMPCYAMDQRLVKVPAGWLIERCGWKGKTLGPVAVHGNQALVLINKGGATGLDVINLSDTIRENIRQVFGIDLTPEVNFVFG